MGCLCRALLWGPGVLAAGLVVSAAVRADALSAVQVLREGGCGGIFPAAPPLRHEVSLDQAARQWAIGHSLSAAAEGSGYGGESTAGLRVSAPASSMLEVIRRSGCRTVMNRDLRAVGVYQRGLDTWLVLTSADLAAVSARPPIPAPAMTAVAAAPRRATAPPQPAAPALAARALQLVNQARARGTRCGQRLFAPARPVTLSGTLAGVAFGHAADMAVHNYFEHVDLAGQSPADRVRAVGYPEKLVGENIAYGPASVEEAVQGWLDSPGHCENIMDPRFAEMGIASAAGRASRRGLYWVQVLAEPRA
jgi:uncharacterized protein YkwD